MTQEEDQLRRPMILIIIRLLTKWGEANAVLSMYYATFMYLGKQYGDLLLRLSIFETKIEDDLQQFISNVKILGWIFMISWHGDIRNRIFLKLKNAILLYHYAFGVNEKEYNSHICSECCSTFNFFLSVVKNINNVKDIIPENDNVTNHHK